MAVCQADALAIVHKAMKASPDTHIGGVALLGCTCHVALIWTCVASLLLGQVRGSIDSGGLRLKKWAQPLAGGCDSLGVVHCLTPFQVVSDCTAMAEPC